MPCVIPGWSTQEHTHQKIENSCSYWFWDIFSSFETLVIAETQNPLKPMHGAACDINTGCLRLFLNFPRIRRKFIQQSNEPINNFENFIAALVVFARCLYMTQVNFYIYESLAVSRNFYKNRLCNIYNLNAANIFQILQKFSWNMENFICKIPNNKFNQIFVTVIICSFHRFFMMSLGRFLWAVSEEILDRKTKISEKDIEINFRG